MNMFARTDKLCTKCNLLNKKLISSYTNFNHVQSEKSKFGLMILRIKHNLMIKQAHEMRTFTGPFLLLALFVRVKVGTKYLSSQLNNHSWSDRESLE